MGGRPFSRRRQPMPAPPPQAAQSLSPAGTLTEMKALSIHFESAIISYCDNSPSCCSGSIGGKVAVTCMPIWGPT